MGVLDIQTTIYGVVSVIGALSIMASAYFMPPATPRMRRAIRLFKAFGILYIGAWWTGLGLQLPHSAEVSRLYLRPVIFLIFLLVSLGVHYDTIAHFQAWRLRRRER